MYNRILQHVVLYLSFILIAAFVILSKTFSPIWLLLIVMAMLWPERKKENTRPLFLLALLLLLLSLLFTYFTILIPFIIGIGLAYILAPIVDLLEKKRVPKILAILICLLPVVAVLPLLVFFIISGLVDETQGLIKILPAIIQQVQLYFRAGVEKLAELGMDIDPNIIANTITNQLNNILTGLFSTISQVGRGIGSIIIIIYNLVIIPLSAYLLLADRKRIMDWFRNLFSTTDRKQVDGFIRKLNFSLARFFRGQLILMTIVGFIIGFALWILGIRYYLLLGFIAGICNLIPNIGYILSLIPAILIGLTSMNPLVNLIKIVSVYAGEQIVENLYLGPVIIGRVSRLHPLVVMVALIIGGTTFGIWGVVLAVPVTIFVREFLNFFLNISV
jgi:predicted PurR-regulated permease PerM